MKISKIWKRISNIIDSLKHHTKWLNAIVGVVYFVLFTVLLSSNLFVSTLHLTVGEPSPQLITAPSDKSFEDKVKYVQDQELATKAVQPVYKPDEDFLNSFNKDLKTVFLAWRDAVATIGDEKSRVEKLKETKPFSDITNGVLTSLIGFTPEQISTVEQMGSDILLSRAKNVDTGARTNLDVASLRDQTKLDITQSGLNENAKIFFRAFADQELTRPTLMIDDQTTETLREAARSNTKKENISYKTNQKIVGAGEIVDNKTYQALEAYGLISSRNIWKASVGIAFIVLIGMGIILGYLFQYKRTMLRSTNRIVLIGLTMSLVLFIGRGMIALNLGGSDFDAMAAMLIPVAWATMTITVLIGADVAILVSVVLAIFVAILVDPVFSTSYGMQTGLVALFGGIVGVYSVSHLSQRSDLARAGLFISAVNALIVSGIAIATGMRLPVWAVGITLGIVNGVMSSALTVGMLHWFESGFQITSSARLLELTNPNRPLLKRLLIEAPGTYHHSILVGNLAEAAAEAVHADAILVRAGAMYHDIGKIKRPYFFIENQFAQDNPHDKIAPTLSALIITSHIKDGLELAKEYKLPQQIQDIIAQHHGDGLVSFFYHKALEENEEVPEESFHYEGPKPQTKEAALVAMADTVEAAVRSLRQPTPGRVEGFIRKSIKDKLNDGQFDQCDLTFQDLDRIAMAFVRVLSGIFHSRIEYPEMPCARENAIVGSSKKLLEEPGKKNGNSTDMECDFSNEDKETEQILIDDQDISLGDNS